MASGVETGAVLGTVLVVDDSGYARIRLKSFLLERGFTRVVDASDGDSALEQFKRHKPCLVLMDQVMRGCEGVETARLMLALDPGVNVVMLTAVTDRAFHERSLAIGVRKVLPKLDMEALAATLHELGHE